MEVAVLAVVDVLRRTLRVRGDGDDDGNDFLFNELLEGW